MSIRSSCGALILAVLLPRAGIEAAERLTMAVSPSQAFAPANVCVRLHIEPSDDVRSVEIVADSGDFYRKSVIPLNGEQAPRQMIVELRNLPGGTYEIRAALLDRSEATMALARTGVRVILASGEQ